MKKLTLGLILLTLILCSNSYAIDVGLIRMRTVDGNTNGIVWDMIVPNGTLSITGATATFTPSGVTFSLPDPTGKGTYILRANAGGTDYELVNSLSGITLSGFTASKALCSDGSGNAVACTNLTDVTPLVTGTPALGAATATSLLATGIVDGTAPIVLTVTSAGYTLGSTYKSGYTFTNPVTAGAAFIMTLPVAAAGLQYCVGNGAAKTGTLTVNTNKPGGAGTQYIDLDGILTANTGNVNATAVAGNLACFVGVDATHWKAIPTKGTWAKGP